MNNETMSMSRILLIFYVFVAGNYTQNLMGKQLKTFFEESRIAQHIIGFVTMMVIIMLFGDIKDVTKVVTYGIIGYLWFVFTTKLDIQWNLIIVLSLFLIYLYENNLLTKEEDIDSDINLTEKEKEKVITKNNNFRSYVMTGVVVTTLIGMYFYINKKEGQYGGGFNMLNFLIY